MNSSSMRAISWALNALIAMMALGFIYYALSQVFLVASNIELFLKIG